MKNEQDKRESVDEREEQEKTEASRRDFLRIGGMGLAGMAGAAALGMQSSNVYAQAKPPGKR